MRDLVLDPLLHADQVVVEALGDLRAAPLTAFFVLVSAWWVKGPLLIAVGVCRDLGGRCLPITALATAVAVGLGSLLSSLFKELFDRARPPVHDPAFQAAVSVPGSPSFPSGHATTAFAAATALAVLSPRLRVPALAVAAAVALSRVYLGVHYGLDVLAGAVLGTMVGVGVALALRALAGAGWPAARLNG